MANKFLPFVVESSTPIYIFQNLLARSKSMNSTVVASIFYLTLTAGAEAIRTYAKSLPDMPLEKLYEELLARFPEARIRTGQLDLFVRIMHHMSAACKGKIHESLAEFELNDVAMFFMVLSQNADTRKHIKDHASLDFADIPAMYNQVLNNVPKYVKFSDEGVPMSFKDPLDLQAFILCQALINKSNKMKAVRASFDTDKSGGKANASR